MIKQLFTQTLFLIRKQPLLSVLSIGGTALAICLIMLLVMFRQVRLVPYAPESDKDRMLFVQYIKVTNDESNSMMSGSMSLHVARECFGKLTSPQFVSFQISHDPMLVSGPDKQLKEMDVRPTDAAFFRIFDFQFIAGRPFNEAEATSGIPHAVITRSLARRMYDTEDVVGKSLQINFKEFTLVGVVEDVSALARFSAAQLWFPYTAIETDATNDPNRLMGSVVVVIKAHSVSDFPIIRRECDSLQALFNSTIAPQEMDLMGQPDNKEVAIERYYSNLPPDMKSIRRHRWLVYLILLLVPAINLSAMTHSRMQQRIEEIAVRRAFGSTRSAIFVQVFAENLIYTLLGTIIGFLLCLLIGSIWSVSLFSGTDLYFTTTPLLISPIALFHFSTLATAFSFCLLMNLLTTGIPAWKASSTQIAGALSGKIERS